MICALKNKRSNTKSLVDEDSQVKSCLNKTKPRRQVLHDKPLSLIDYVSYNMLLERIREEGQEYARDF